MVKLIGFNLLEIRLSEKQLVWQDIILQLMRVSAGRVSDEN